MNKIQLYIIGVLIFIVVFELSVIDLYRKEVINLKAQFQFLYAESQKEEQKVKIAQTEAIQEIKQIQTNVKNVMATTIDKGCDSAIKWGISQAKGFV